MTAPLPDPKLRRAMELNDKLRNELKRARMSAGQYKAKLAKLTTDAKPKQREQRAGR
jgi:hypothetical protein